MWPVTDLVPWSGGALPRVVRGHYWRVLAQLLWRMRLDLLVVFGLVLVSLLYTPLKRQIDLITDLGLLPFLGITVSVFLAFRSNHAIQRWWEARGLWGALVNQSRHWRDTLETVVSPAQLHGRHHQQLLGGQVVMVWLLNFELRNAAQRVHLKRVEALAQELGLGPELSVQELCLLRARTLGDLHAANAVSDLGRDALLRSAELFTDAVGGLQKIRNTPIPAAYDLFIRLLAWLFGLLLFWEFKDSGEPTVGVLLFLAFLVAERIGAFVEVPFAREGNGFALPLNQFCLLISDDLLGQGSPFVDAPRCFDPSQWN